ncbi:MAG: branched-chain amino acid ABC transporter permease [Desulfobacterales bacterium]|nr:branched-chain amino acid ABC transporter permease [Desulfobacterales bacterium]
MSVVVYGFINSLILALFAIGFSLAFGVSGIPNFSHGALYILCGYITWILLTKLGLPLAVCIILALGITALIGGTMYQLILRRVRGMPASEVMVSLSIGIAIMELLRWGGLRGGSVTLPPFIDGSIQLLGVPVDYQRIIIMIAAAALVLGLWLFTHFTDAGLSLRAIAQDEGAALMLGIDSDHTAVLAMSLGSALAGLAAVLILPTGNITVEGGYEVLTFAIAVCVCGGLGRWFGAVLAAFIIGYAQMITVHFVAAAYHMVVAMLAIVIILIAKPSGLFGRQKELEERV